MLFIYQSYISEALALQHLGEILSGVADCGDEVVADSQGDVTTAVGMSANSHDQIIATYNRHDRSFRMIGPESYVQGMSLDWPDRRGALITELPEKEKDKMPAGSAQT